MSVLDAGLAADLLAAVGEGNALRTDMATYTQTLREVTGVGGLSSAQRVRAELLDCAGAATEAVERLEPMWREAAAALADQAWKSLAADSERWRGQFVAERVESPVPTRDAVTSLNPTPPSRFNSFGELVDTGIQRAVHIPGEDVVGLTLDRIKTGLDDAVPEALVRCANAAKGLHDERVSVGRE